MELSISQQITPLILRDTWVLRQVQEDQMTFIRFVM